MSSSTSNSNMFNAYVNLPARERVGHAVMAVAGLLILLAWLHYSPKLVPSCRTMAVHALSPETDALVTGTSRIERGIDPRLLDMNVVNLSSGGLSYLTMKPMIKQAIERAPNTKLVVIEFDIFLLKGKGLINDRLFELGVPMREWPMPLKDRIWYILENGGPLSAMPRLDVEYYAQSIRANERPPPDSNGYNPYVFFRDLKDANSDELYGAAKYVSMHRKELVGSLDEANIRALLELLQWLDDRNIRWAMVTMPHLPGWINGRPDAWEQSVESAIRAVRTHYAGRNVRFWDASADLGLKEPDFHDGLHLNRQGLEVFNRELNQRMALWVDD